MFIQPTMTLIGCLPYWLIGTSCSIDKSIIDNQTTTISSSLAGYPLLENPSTFSLPPAFHLLTATCPLLAQSSPEEVVPVLVSSHREGKSTTRVNDQAHIFSTGFLVSTNARVTISEAYGLQNQRYFCELSEDSPQLGDVVALWSKIVDVGVEWCCTSGVGCTTIGEYRSAEVALCAQREICVRCFHVSFAVGRLMRSCEKNQQVQGSLGTRETLRKDGIPVVRVIPRSRFYLGRP